MVTIVRAAAGEPGIPAGFPILLDREMAIIEPAFAWLMEHARVRGRGRSVETLRTYGEHLHDWFDTLEQSGVGWRDADEGVIAAYRNRMLDGPSPHTGRPFARATINARLHSVCRFYSWAHERHLVATLPFRQVEQVVLSLDAPVPGLRPITANLLTLATPEHLPRPLRADELARLFTKLAPSARLAAEWALTAGLRRKEICGLTIEMIPDGRDLTPDEDPLVGIPLSITKGDRPRTVYPPLRLIDRTNWHIGEERAAIVRRQRRRDRRWRTPDCQSASKTDPRSASKTDPGSLRMQR